MHADLADYEIVVLAPHILQDEQRTVLRVGQFYVPELRRYCPDLLLPKVPTSTWQAAVIGRIEGTAILAHGILQLIGIGADGALQTLGSVASKTVDVLDAALSPTGLLVGGVIAVGAIVLLARK